MEAIQIKKVPLKGNHKNTEMDFNSLGMHRLDSKVTIFCTKHYYRMLQLLGSQTLNTVS